MDRKDPGTLTQREQQRLRVVIEVEAGRWTAEQAAEVLGLSLRHVRRILAAYRKEGVAAIAHGNRCRRPVHALGEEVRQLVVTLAQGPYVGL